MTRNKKAQIKMFETIGILIVFFFLIAISATVYFTFQRAAAQKEIVRQTELRALQIITKTFYLAELECSFLGVRKDACYDVAKLTAFAAYACGADPNDICTVGNPDIRLHYSEFFGTSKVRVTQIFPLPEPGELPASWLLWNEEPKKWRSAPASFSPVLLQDASADTYALGMVELKVYAAD